MKKGRIMQMQKGLEANEQAIQQAIEKDKAYQTEPERLKNIEEIHEQNMPQASQKPTAGTEPIDTESTLKEEKTEEKANTKQKKQVFSFRSMIENIANWKAYATATGETMENIGTAAMNEYLENHKLIGAEQAIFEAMKAKNEK